MEEAEIDFTDDALREVAMIAKKKETGARGLRSVVEECMFDLMYELPDRKPGQKYVLTAEMIRGEESVLPEDGSAAA